MATAPVLDTSATESGEKLPWKVVQCPHEWDVTRPEIYVEDRWHPIFKEMREQAPINKVEGSSFGSYWIKREIAARCPFVSNNTS